MKTFTFIPIPYPPGFHILDEDRNPFGHIAIEREIWVGFCGAGLTTESELRQIMAKIDEIKTKTPHIQS